MAMSGYYLDPDSSGAESIRTIQRALELGVTHIDTAEIYGPDANEELAGRALKGRRDDIVVATKLGLVSHSGEGPGVLDSSPANIRTAIEGSLKRLGTAYAVHPIAALQTEYSLWTRDPEAELLPLLRELGIGLVPYSPLGHGFLTGKIRSPQELADDDWRKSRWPGCSRRATTSRRSPAPSASPASRRTRHEEATNAFSLSRWVCHPSVPVLLHGHSRFGAGSDMTRSGIETSASVLWWPSSACYSSAVPRAISSARGSPPVQGSP
jgi:aryl-alcohol dehydrogenase-like predicted oxidoreductase